MPIRRAVNAIIGLTVFLAAASAAYEALRYRGMTALSTTLLCVVAVLGLLQRYVALLSERRRARRREASTSALQTLAAKLGEIAVHPFGGECAASRK